MKKQEKVDLISSCIGTEQFVRLYFKYDENYWYYYPLKVNEKFVLGLEEDDFLLDGFHVRKISQLVKAEIKDDLCTVINKWNGTFDKVCSSDVDITSWETIFSSPVLRGRFVIVENEIEWEFYIGLITKAGKNKVSLLTFDADGVWADVPTEIPYSSITHLGWNTRYTENWFEYLKEHDMMPKTAN